MASTARLLLALLFLSAATSAFSARGGKELQGVTYDARSLIINGKREIFFSGSIHYPRSTPDMWPRIIANAKLGGINLIQTYVFWNVHEPVQGQYNFEGRYDLVKFIKLIQKNGMYVTLRIGPFIQAEWNHGGFPYWLREVDGITFRTDNPPFKHHMERFVRKIVDMMKEEKLFAAQGGPIILAQIENEYNMVQAAFREGGKKYVQWASDLVLGLGVRVPWMMCKQQDAPGPVINACNGRNCGDTWMGPNHPTKPLLWAENWTAQYRVFGDPPSQRSAEDLAYSVARFFSKNGTLANYYMYHGGTNFGRTGSAFVATRYYDEAPLDEYGLQKEPKWGHLKDLHQALKLSRKALLWGSYSFESLGKDLEARVYELPNEKVCAAFLTNTDGDQDSTIKFRGIEYFLPRRSISILPDCKTVVFNTQRVNAQHNSRTFIPVAEKTSEKWEVYHDHIPRYHDDGIVKHFEPLELMNMTKDTTDYLWYTTSFNLRHEDLPRRNDIRPVLQVASLGHAVHGFANGKYLGHAHGSKIEKSFVFQKPMKLKTGINHITILALTVGFPDSGPYLEHRLAGVHTVAIQGLNTGTLDLTANGWGHQVGLRGEMLQIYTEEGSSRVQWSTKTDINTPVTWYKRYFDAPEGDEPVVIDLSTMGKGLVWVNGEGIGRYWVSNLSPLGTPTQTVYHIPRSFMKPTKNLLVIMEESGGNPDVVQLMTVRRDDICTFVSEYHPGVIRSWSRKEGQLRSVAKDVKPEAHLKCPNQKVIKGVTFASFGNPRGMCGNYIIGSCHASNTHLVVEKACLGKSNCVLPVKGEAYGADANCKGTTATLAVQAVCGFK